LETKGQDRRVWESNPRCYFSLFGDVMPENRSQRKKVPLRPVYLCMRVFGVTQGKRMVW
jgi:hypothetical protein